MSIVDDILDFMQFLFFLGFAVVISFAIVTPIVYEEKAPVSELADKSSPTLRGNEEADSYDGTLTPLEVVLMTQVQDSDIPSPKKYRALAPDMSGRYVEADIESLGSFYKSNYNLNKYGTEVYDLLTASTNMVSKYRVRFVDNGTIDKSDDVYTLEAK